MHVSGLDGDTITHVSSSSTGPVDFLGEAVDFLGEKEKSWSLGQLACSDAILIRQPSVSDDQTGPLPFGLDSG